MQKAFVLILVALLVFGCTGGSYGNGNQGASQTPATGNQSSPQPSGQNPGSSTGEKVVEIINFKFVPDRIEVTPGTTVTWVNMDSPMHSATSDTEMFDTGTFGAGQNRSHLFGGAGEFPYHCSVHPSMKGTVVVVDSVK